MLIYYVPRTGLSILHVLSQSILTANYEIAAIMFPSLQIRRLKPRY